MEASSSFKSTLSLLLITHLFSLYAAAAATPTAFILTSCKPTTYPTLCAESLAAYAPLVRRSPRQLAHAALTVSATRAREASAYVSRLSSGTGHSSVQSQAVTGAVQDCVATMFDSADRLQRSVRQLSHLGRARRPSYSLRLRSVQTWVSAALTDQNTCLASLMEGGIGGSGRIQVAAIREKVSDVSRITSNALSLVNRLGYRK